MEIGATKSRLGSRLAVCQIAGTIAGILITSLFGFLTGPHRAPLTGSYAGDLFVVLTSALVFGIPFYAASVLVLQAFTKSILARPLLWCVGLPGLALVGAIAAFSPTEYQGVHWIVLIPLCASLAGGFFYWWQATRPLTCVR